MLLGGCGLLGGDGGSDVDSSEDVGGSSGDDGPVFAGGANTGGANTGGSGGIATGGGATGGSATGGTGGTLPACDDGTFRAGAECQPFDNCESGEFVAKPGTPTSDRVCEPCGSDGVSTDTNAAQCTLVPPRFEMVSVGVDWGCGLTTERRVRCWGLNHGAPARDTEFVDVAVAYWAAVAIRAEDNRLECWGDSFTCDDVPTDVAYRSLSASAAIACGIRLDDTGVDCWGSGASISTDGAFKTIEVTDTGVFCGIMFDGEARCVLGSEEPWFSRTGLSSLVVSGDSLCGLREADGSTACWYQAGPYEYIEYEGPAVVEVLSGSSRWNADNFGLTAQGALVRWSGTGDHAAVVERPGPYAFVDRYEDPAVSVGCGIAPDSGQVECWDDVGNMPVVTSTPSATTVVWANRDCWIDEEGVGVCAFPDSVTPGPWKTWNRSCGIRADGSLFCPSSSFTKTGPYEDVVSGDGKLCGLRSDTRQLECWNGAGELAAQPSGEFVEVADDGFGELMCGLSPQGRAQCWWAAGSQPAVVPTTSFVRLSVGRTANASAACGLTAAGRVECWGALPAGLEQATQPADLVLTDVALQYNAICGIRAGDRRVECWGAYTQWINAPDAPFLSIDEEGCGVRADTHTRACFDGVVLNQ